MSYTVEDITTALKKLSPTMREALDRAAWGHRPKTMNTLVALMKRKLVERVMVDDQIVRRLTPLGWRVWAMMNLPLRPDHSLVSELTGEAKMSGYAPSLYRLRRAYQNAALIRHHSIGFGSSYRRRHALEDAKHIEQWADALTN